MVVLAKNEFDNRNVTIDGILSPSIFESERKNDELSIKKSSSSKRLSTGTLTLLKEMKQLVLKKTQVQHGVQPKLIAFWDGGITERGRSKTFSYPLGYF